MKVKLLGIKGYNYMKDGVQKTGITLAVQSTELLAEDDGNGNFAFGYWVDTVFLPRHLYSKVSASDLQQFIGREINLTYEKRLGDRYERLTDIVPTEEA